MFLESSAVDAGILRENIFQVIGINTIWAVVLCSS
jgi:hypothetical protein